VAGALVAGAFFILGMVALTVARGRLAAFFGWAISVSESISSSEDDSRSESHSPFFFFVPSSESLFRLMLGVLLCALHFSGNLFLQCNFLFV
jgi:hypothetical protein